VVSPAITFSIIIGGALGLIALERRFPYAPQQCTLRRGFFLDLIWYAAVQSYVLSLVIALIIAAIDFATGWSRHGLISEWPVWCQVLFFLVTHDLYIYSFHRLQHHSAFLWRIHEAHHSPHDVDWLSGARSHPLEILVNQTVEFAPILLLGAAPEVPAIKGALDSVWGMYIHSNIDVRSGWLQRIINGPEMHRWHHAQEMVPGKNFATKFAVWDWMFGTAYLPSHKPAVYGLVPHDGANFPHDGRRLLGWPRWASLVLSPLAAYGLQTAFSLLPKRLRDGRFNRHHSGPGVAEVRTEAEFSEAKDETHAKHAEAGPVLGAGSS
jgi:sterol desaturase/sphingolipid hydroxylase (fatty acid hydroxylase superfamily)